MIYWLAKISEALYMQIFVISSQKIQHKGYETLYKYTTRNPKAAVSRYVSSVPAQWQVYLALGIQKRYLSSSC